MQHLDLRPLPCVDSGENFPLLKDSPAGFVEDAVVFALLSGSGENRPPGNVGLLELAADLLDYAGWPASGSNDPRFVRLS